MRRGKGILTFIIIILVLAVLGGGGYLGYTKYIEFTTEIAAKDAQIEQLKSTVESVGELVDVFVVRSNVKVGKIIEETDLQRVDTPVSMAGTAITVLDDALGKYYKLDIAKGSILTSDMIMDDKLDDSMRLYDIVTDENPIGIKPGTYVDIRISMPYGEDFIAMSHKRVHSVTGGVLKLAVNENDIHSYNSMLVDKILYKGTRIYAVEYVEPGVQTSATNYYPISSNVLAIAEKDPNLLEAVRQDMIARRTQVETSLNTLLTPELADIIEQGKKEITAAMTDSQKQFEQQEAKAAVEQKLADQE